MISGPKLNSYCFEKRGSLLWSSQSSKNSGYVDTDPIDSSEYVSKRI